MIKKIKNTRYLPYLIVIIIILLILTIIATLNSGANTISYQEIENVIKNKDDIIIYYYNSSSSNFNNLKIKRYLNKQGIRYSDYDDKNIDKKEYNQLLKLLKIDKKVFACPSLIYIKEGKMYGNIIAIDNTKTVKQFLDNYDLYTVK